MYNDIVRRCGLTDPPVLSCYDHLKRIESAQKRHPRIERKRRNELQRPRVFPSAAQHRAVKVGRLTLGGDAAVVVQSMTKTDTRDLRTRRADSRWRPRVARSCVSPCLISKRQRLTEIRKLCPDSILVSDIHFQYKFALMALDAASTSCASIPAILATPKSPRRGPPRAGTARAHPHRGQRRLARAAPD